MHLVTYDHRQGTDQYLYKRKSNAILAMAQLVAENLCELSNPDMEEEVFRNLKKKSWVMAIALYNDNVAGETITCRGMNPDDVGDYESRTKRDIEHILQTRKRMLQHAKGP